MKKQKKVHPMGKETPYAWVIETVHGCNLSCGHCCNALTSSTEFDFMDLKIWKNCWHIINETAPTIRVDLCLAGEPTLHPDLIRFLKIARKIAPLAQMQITTNGTMIAKGKYTYKQLLDAGANIIYTDMYAPKELFKKLAKESGYDWYEYYNAPKGAINPWAYYGPDVKVIVLQEQPENWPKSRLKAGLLGTWYNHLDWDAAKRFGLKPVVTPPARRCNQPFQYVSIHVSGSYLLCCQDGWGEGAGQFGNVSDGVAGFKKYWFGEQMMTIRRRLRNKNRIDTPYCSRCCITFSRCDYINWKENELNMYWNGIEWIYLPDQNITDPKWTLKEKQKKKGIL
jgi:organic radical activating enzyme